MIYLVNKHRIIFMKKFTIELTEEEIKELLLIGQKLGHNKKKPFIEFIVRDYINKNKKT